MCQDVTFTRKSMTNSSMFCKNLNVWHVHFSYVWWQPFSKTGKLHFPTLPKLLSSFYRLQVDHHGMYHSAFPQPLLCLNLYPPHTPPPPPPSPCLACHERDAEAALLLSTSSIFICQTAVSTAVLAGLQCFVCSVEFVGVHVVCACARSVPW